MGDDAGADVADARGHTYEFERDVVAVCWLLSRILAERPSVVLASFSPDMVNLIFLAVTRFASSRRSTFRIYSFRLLSHMLALATAVDGRPVDLDAGKLARVHQEVLDQHEAEQDEESLFSPATQSGVELLHAIERYRARLTALDGTPSSSRRRRRR